MSLVHGYSSDEDDVHTTPSDDVFGISSIAANSRNQTNSLVKVDTSAPDVLEEVRC